MLLGAAPVAGTSIRRAPASASVAQARDVRGEGRHRGQAAQRRPRGGAGSGQKAPRLAASIAPGPPPVATRSPVRASAAPRCAASAYGGVPALEGVAAHHADDGPAVDQLVEGVGHRVVVDGAQQRHEGVAAGRGVARPAVGAGVGRARRSRGRRARRTAPAAGRGSPGRGRPARAGRWGRSGRRQRRRWCSSSGVSCPPSTTSPSRSVRPSRAAARRRRSRPCSRRPASGAYPGQGRVQRVQALDLHGRILAGPGAASCRPPGMAHDSREPGAGSAAQAGPVHLAVEAHAGESAQDGADEAGHRDHEQGDDAAGGERCPR